MKYLNDHLDFNNFKMTQVSGHTNRNWGCTGHLTTPSLMCQRDAHDTRVSYISSHAQGLEIQSYYLVYLKEQLGS